MAVRAQGLYVPCPVRVGNTPSIDVITLKNTSVGRDEAATFAVVFLVQPPRFDAGIESSQIAVQLSRADGLCFYRIHASVRVTILAVFQRYSLRAPTTKCRQIFSTNQRQSVDPPCSLTHINSYPSWSRPGCLRSAGSIYIIRGRWGTII